MSIPTAIPAPLANWSPKQYTRLCPLCEEPLPMILVGEAHPFCLRYGIDRSKWPASVLEPQVTVPVIESSDGE